MTSAGYLVADTEYKMVGAHFAQSPCPTDCAVVRIVTGTGFDVGLTALISTFSNFWGVAITSTNSTDQEAVGTWMTNNGFGQAINRANSASISGAKGRCAWINSDHLLTAGYQLISSSPTPFAGNVIAGLSGTFNLQVQFDNGTNHSISITVTSTETWAQIAAAIQSAIEAATGGQQTCIIDQYGNINIASTTLGDSSEVNIQDGATSGLLTAINSLAGYQVTVNTAVAGSEEYPEAAWYGRKLTQGYLTWAFKQLSGVINSNYSSTQLSQMNTNHLNWVQQQNGVNYTYQGTNEDGSFIDTNYFIDYLKSQLQIAILGVLLNNESVPFDINGFGLIESAMRTVFTQFGKLGTIKVPSTQADLELSDLGDYMYRLNIPSPDDVNANDELNRLLTGITATVQGSGAVHGVQVNISIVE